MKKIFSIMSLCLVVHSAVAQENKTQILIDGQLIQNFSEVDSFHVQNICALQFRHPDLPMDFSPINFEIVVSKSIGFKTSEIFIFQCSQKSKKPYSINKILPLKKGDSILFGKINFGDLKVSEAIKKQIKEIRLIVK